jgi:hypothetical protein
MSSLLFAGSRDNTSAGQLEVVPMGITVIAEKCLQRKSAG